MRAVRGRAPPRPEKYVFEPHTAPAAVLKAAGVKIGTDYPLPLVDHSTVAKANMKEWLKLKRTSRIA